MNTKPSQGPGVVLAVDDESDILYVMQASLEADGFVVYTATDPREGLALFEKHADEIDVVLLDFRMPHLRGDELFVRMKQIKPRVKVILVTASRGEEIEGMLAEGVVGHVRKPFSIDDLARRIRAAIAAK
jgi:two-component system cell cycle sensor histidine kinase/response regulator CckA